MTDQFESRANVRVVAFARLEAGWPRRLRLWMHQFIGLLVGGEAADIEPEGRGPKRIGWLVAVTCMLMTSLENLGTRRLALLASLTFLAPVGCQQSGEQEGAKAKDQSTQEESTDSTPKRSTPGDDQTGESTGTGGVEGSGSSETTSESDTSSTPKGEDSTTKGPGELPKDEIPAELEEIKSDKPREKNPDVEVADLRVVRAGNNNLGFEVLRRLEPKDGQNMAVSPLSLQQGLGLVYAAARTETQQEIQKALGYHGDATTTHKALNQFAQQLAFQEEKGSEESGPVVIRIANRTFVKPGFTVGRGYLDTLATQYGAGVYVADFPGDADGVAEKINGWVSANTRGKIPEIFPPKALKPTTVWAFVNAVYFKAPWRSPFPVAATSKQKFTKLDDSTMQVQMMRAHHKHARYGQSDQAQWASLPLGNKGGLEAVFVLPKAGEFAKVEAEMNNDKLDAILNASDMATVDMSLPKFKIKTGSLGLGGVFEAMGVRKLFGDADLSGISDDGSVSLPGLEILNHSVFVAMDEEGVEAAAATGGAAQDSEPTDIKTLTLDRPFLFMIYDRVSGLVLFNGRVVNPTF